MLSGIVKFFQRKQVQAQEPTKQPDQDSAVAHYKLANQLRDRGDLVAALDAYDQAIARNPKYANALCNRGVVLQRLSRHEAALDSFDRAIALEPGDFLAFYNRAAVLLALHRPNEALASYDDAIAIKPDYLEAYCNRGNLLSELDRIEEALASYDRSIEINSHFHHAYLGRGALLLKRRQWDAAHADFAKAIEMKPDCAEAHSGLGTVLRAMRRFEPALDSFAHAIELRPDFAEAHCGLGNLLMDLNRHEEALVSFDRAVSLDPTAVNALLCRADALYVMKRFEGALASCDQALAFKPDADFQPGMRLFIKLHLCDWRDLEAALRNLAEGIEAGKRMTHPFQALSLLDSAALHLRVAETWTADRFPSEPFLGPIPKRSARTKIRVGYFSADYKNHPVAVLLAQILEAHDRDRYEIIAFSFGFDAADDMRQRLEGAFDRFIDVRGQSDLDVVLLARELEIDIAVDLAGYTVGARTRIFALRVAPVQVNYLGYPGTMGAPYMDYLIGDYSVSPEEHQAYFCERIVYMPNSYLPNDSTRAISSTVFSREALGLPPTGFVFCCFNANYKFSPHTFDSWMRILERVPGAVLWLSGSHPTAVSNLRQEAARRGIDPARLIFAGRMTAPEDHLARLRTADLFLDTLPYNAHATAMDALWAGLPVLTLVGKAFAGRVGASLLSSLGLPELIVSTASDYEDLAVQLATDSRRLAELRQMLAGKRLSAPLFDSKAFTGHLEAGYARMMERYWKGLAPAPIHIQARSQ